MTKQHLIQRECVGRVIKCTQEVEKRKHHKTELTEV